MFWPYCLQEFPWNQKGSRQHVCCSLRLLILGDFWVQVFILTRGAVGFINNEVFFLMFPSCQSHLNREWSISVCALMSSSTGAQSSASRAYRCFRTGRGLTKIDSDIFWSLLVFFSFFFFLWDFCRKTFYLFRSSTSCNALFSIFFPTNRKIVFNTIVREK